MLDFALLPDDRWPGRLVAGGKTLKDFVAIGEGPSNRRFVDDPRIPIRFRPDAANPRPMADDRGRYGVDSHPRE